MKTLLFLLLAFCLYTAPAHADPVRLQRLGYVFTDFREGFIYWSQCGDFKKETAAHPRFMKNWDLLLAAYMAEAHAQNPYYTRDELAAAMKKKSVEIQNGLVDRYQDKNVCTSPYANQVRKNIAMFDNQSPANMEKMLSDIGK